MISTSTLLRCPLTPSWTTPSRPAASPWDTYTPSAGPVDPGLYSPKMLAQPKLTPELHKAYDKAVARFGKVPGAQLSVSAGPASGGRPVVTVRHQSADSKNLTVQTHFHGFQVYDKKVGYDQRIAQTVESAWAKDKNTVFVFPEARDEATPGYRAEWGNIQSVTDLTRKAVEEAGLPAAGIQRTVLSGHSAGGTPVAKALARAQEGKDGPFTRVELYDAAVQSNGTELSAAERKAAREYTRKHASEMLLVPGTMRNSWESWLPQSRHAKQEKDHFETVWVSLGQYR